MIKAMYNECSLEEADVVVLKVDQISLLLAAHQHYLHWGGEVCGGAGQG